MKGMIKLNLSGKNIGIGITGSFCTFDKIIPQLVKLVEQGANVYPVLSNNAQSINSRFGDAKDFMEIIYDITKNKIITSIEDAEPIGPNQLFDIFLIAPCTGNTLAKLNNAITDTPVLMAAKAQLRSNKPVVLSISTNDALGMNFVNIPGKDSPFGFYFIVLAALLITAVIVLIFRKKKVF